jgi:hypothetical protein
MDNKELKAMLKPLIKQCIREVLVEEGLGKIIAESKTESVKETKEQPQVKKVIKEQTVQITEARKKMLEEIGKSGYMSNKFDPFAGTKPLTEAQASNAAAGPMSNIDPSDPGVDISNLLSGNKNTWKTLVAGKAK